MSEEQEKGGFFSNLKNQIIAGAGVALTTIGGVFFDEVKGLLGIADEEEGGEKIEMVQQQQQQQSNNQQVIINIPEQKPAETKTIIKEVPAKPVEKPKEKEQEIDW
jgi:inorganic pyrophosphatase